MVLACGAAGPRTTLPPFPLEVGAKVKVAEEPAQRYRGLHKASADSSS